MTTKKKQKKIKDKQRTKTDNDLNKINIFWTVLPGWNDLTYEEKLSWYWKFEVSDGKRTFSPLK